MSHSELVPGRAALRHIHPVKTGEPGEGHHFAGCLGDREGRGPERNRASSIRRSYVSKGWVGFPPRRPTLMARTGLVQPVEPARVRGQRRNVPRPSSQRSCETNCCLRPFKLTVFPELWRIACSGTSSALHQLVRGFPGQAPGPAPKDSGFQGMNEPRFQLLVGLGDLARPGAESQRGVCYTGSPSPDPWMQKTALSANPSLYLLSLGCPKNRVDSEVMLGSLLDEGYRLVDEPEEAEVILINSCAFIGEAKQESIDAILEHARHKETGRCKALVVAGCLTQRYADVLQQEMPEVDHFVGTSAYPRIARILKGERDRAVIPDPDYIADSRTPRRNSMPRWTAYVKIAEGCDNKCTFCIIPTLRGL